ncbi:hypothetical protein KY084_11625 [Stakelama sp. CBK3Z-3]|uniref:DUF4148 domain-containing protein n=1 Tax=Stakelama flava TaxID=2860338 RepID=A0ABS6XMU1_9SPHN|nr:hypothetical protein [Stakelama flava]MBW4331517.1 hypothetical protein [Stakelama flava]
MKTFTLMLAGIGIATAAMPATVTAAPRQSANISHVQIERQIDQREHDGRIGRRDARSLRVEYRQLARLEARYRRSGHGLSSAERRDLDRRYAMLERKLRHDSHSRGGDSRQYHQANYRR